MSKSNIMKTTTYIKITANVISSVSNKSVYLVNPVSANGTVYKNAWIPKRWTDKLSNETVTITWAHAREQLTEFPMSKITSAMRYDKTDDNGRSLVKARLVDGKIVHHLELIARYEFEVPNWLMRNFKIAMKPVYKDNPLWAKNDQEELFSNDNDFYTVAEDTALRSHERLTLQDRVNDVFTGGATFEPHITAWENDNPDYQ